MEPTSSITRIHSQQSLSRTGAAIGGVMPVYCAQCGKASQEEAKFCSACGRPLTPEGTAFSQAATYRPMPTFGTLHRPREGRKVAGVCQGIANHYGWDVSVVRVVMLLLAIAAFPIGLIIYGLVWLIAPEEPLSLPASSQGSTYVSQS